MGIEMQTSRSLLQQLAGDGESHVWNRLVSLYTPLIERWLQRNSVHQNDVGDLLQEVLYTLACDLPSFQHNGRIGAFRSWLRQVTLNRCRRYWEARGKSSQVGSEKIYEMLNQLQDPSSELTHRWNEEYDQHVLGELLAIIQSDFAERTIAIFRRTAIEGVPAPSVAAEFSVKVGQVYKAKFRVMSRLREEADRLLDGASIEISTRRKDVESP